MERIPASDRTREKLKALMEGRSEVANGRSELVRLAARPVGAHSAIATVFARRILRIELTSVVLPTPGPPVITNTFEASATRTASIWLSASVSFVCFSTQGIALSASINGQGGFPDASR